MDFEQFFKALTQVAAKAYPQTDLLQAFEVLLEEHILKLSETISGEKIGG